MIYAKFEDQMLLIIEPGNIQRLREGQPLVTPDQKVIVAYCPDLEWLSQKMQELQSSGELTTAVLDALLKEGLTRPEVSSREPHSYKRIV